GHRQEDQGHEKKERLGVRHLQARPHFDEDGGSKHVYYCRKEEIGKLQRLGHGVEAPAIRGEKRKSQWSQNKHRHIGKAMKSTRMWLRFQLVSPDSPGAVEQPAGKKQ